MAGNHLVILIQGLTKYYTELQPAETETQHLIQSSARLADNYKLKINNRHIWLYCLVKNGQENPDLEMLNKLSTASVKVFYFQDLFVTDV